MQEDTRNKLDLAFEDAGEHQLKNIAWPVRVYRVRLEGVAAKPSCTGAPRQAINCCSAIPEPERGSGPGVLRRQSRRGDHNRTGSLRGFFVIARGSAFTLQGRAVGVKQIGRELGVRYV